MNIVRIVGCGTIGSNLCLNFCKLGLFQEIHVYDDAVVNYTETPEFPFLETFLGLPKVEALMILFQSLQFNSSTKFFAYEKKVLRNFRSDGLIIDCRDNKLPKIKSHIRCAIDANVLYVDCRDDYETEDEFTEYVEQRNPQFIDLAVSIITAFMLDELYENKEFKMYDLKRVLYGGIEIT